MRQCVYIHVTSS